MANQDYCLTKTAPSGIIKESFCWWGVLEGVYIPEFLLSYRGIGPAAKLCFARLTKYTRQNETCWPSQEELAEALGVSVRSVGNYLAELEQDGFIEIIQRGLQQSNAYRPLRHPILNEAFGGTTSDPDRKNLSGQDTQTSSGPSIELKEVIKKEIINTIPLTGSPSKEKTDPDLIFREVRSARGRKPFSAKQRTLIRENWVDGWSEMPAADVLELIDGLLPTWGSRAKVDWRKIDRAADTVQRWPRFMKGIPANSATENQEPPIVERWNQITGQSVSRSQFDRDEWHKIEKKAAEIPDGELTEAFKKAAHIIANTHASHKNDNYIEFDWVILKGWAALLRSNKHNWLMRADGAKEPPKSATQLVKEEILRKQEEKLKNANAPRPVA